MINDFRFALRMLLKNPGFTAVVVALVALGIGANIAIFSLIDAVLLRTLPVKNPEELLMPIWSTPKLDRELFHDSSGWGGCSAKTGLSSDCSFSYPAFKEIQARNDVFSDVLGFAGLGRVTIVIDGEAQFGDAEPVSGNFFSVLGVQPVLGRTLEAKDDLSNASPVTVISYGFWETRFGGDLSALGKSIIINGVPFTIVGVTPVGFSCLQPNHTDDLWVPLATLPRLGSHISASSFAQRDNWWVLMVGRLKLGVSEAQARADLNLIFHQSLTSQQPSTLERGNLPEIDLVSSSKGLEGLRQQFSRPLLILMGIVGLVQLIACANVANLLLARARAREREIAVRLAIGLTRARLFRLLLTESALLAVIGGGTGLILARWITTLLLSLMSFAGQSLALKVQTNISVLVFTAGISVFTGILFGLAPALQATRLDLAASLKVSNTRQSGQSGLRLSSGQSLVLVQVAISLPLLIGAGLFVRTLQNLREVKLGFSPEPVLLFGLDPSQRTNKTSRATTFYKELLQELESLPEVCSASLSGDTLMSGSEWTTGISIPGFAQSEGENVKVHGRRIGPKFLETMGIPLVFGRIFTTQEMESTPKSALVNQAFARQYFGDANPVGKHFRWGQDKDIEIVGLVGNAKYSDLTLPAPPTAYFPYRLDEQPTRSVYFAVKAAGDPRKLISPVRQLIRQLDPNLPLFDVKTQSEQINERLFHQRIFAQLTSGFGMLALGLTCVGLYGTLSYAVARRTSEIGIRMALGACRDEVLRMVLKGALLLILGGIGLGLPLALAATRLISSYLFGVTAIDSLTISLSILLLLAVGAIAAYLPARRASRVDPMVALRCE